MFNIYLWLQSGYKGNILQNHKGHVQQPTANNIFSSENLKTFPLRSRTRQGCLFSLFVPKIVWEVLVTAIRQEKSVKGIQIGKEEVKLSYDTIHKKS